MQEECAIRRAMTIDQIEKRIGKIKTELAEIQDMRPGSLSRQYNVCGVKGCRCKDTIAPNKHGPYTQLSYVHQGKSTTRFIRPHQVRAVRSQLAAYKRFRKLTQEWVHLAIEHAQLKLELTRNDASK
jgi:hypothetical protein